MWIEKTLSCENMATAILQETVTLIENIRKLAVK